MEYRVVMPSSGMRTFELIQLDITHNSRTLRLIIVYRPSGSAPFNDFLEEFSNFLDDQVYPKASDLLISGDFNIHMDSSCTNTRDFCDLVTSFNLKQHVCEPTHNRGHILDLLITRQDDIIATHDIKVIEGISDHAAIICKLDIPVKSCSK